MQIPLNFNFCFFSSSRNTNFFSLLRMTKNKSNETSSDEAKQQIAFIMEKISMLRPAEKMLLYLKMPGAQSDSGKFHTHVLLLLTSIASIIQRAQILNNVRHTHINTYINVMFLN